nr:DUF2461 domain-containing protein [uncultured Flavobacterium sp.]
MALENVFSFLEVLKKNNNREWFTENKVMYEQAHAEAKILFEKVYTKLEEVDSLEPLKVYRIYRDVRFSKDKLPYKNHLAASVQRQKPTDRGGFYIHLEPGNSFIGGGFWGPEPQDLLRIRQEFLWDDEIINILSDQKLKDFYGEIQGDELKTAPKGFDKIHERIHLIRKKQFIFTKHFTDAEVQSKDFDDKILEGFLILQPFYQFMTAVLTTNGNGE